MSVTRKDRGTWVVGDMEIIDALTVGGAFTITGGITIAGDFEIGESGDGSDLKAWGDTAGYYMTWDADADTNGGLIVIGTTDLTGNLTVDGTLVSIDGATSVRGISAGFTSLESPANRFGSDAAVYMQVATTATTGVTAITHTGSGPTVTWTANSFSFVGAFSADSASTAVVDGATSFRGISAGFTSLEAPNVRFGVNATEYMDVAVTATTGAVAITHTGSGPAVTWTADSFGLTGDVTITPTVTGIDIGSASSYGISLLGTYENAIRITMSKATTAQAGVRLLNTYTAVDGYHLGLMGAVIIAPTGGTGYGGAIGVFGEANIQGIHTGGTNYSFGVRGTLQLNDTTVINDGSSIFGAINASMKDNATPTLTAGHICGIYVENLIDADLSAITGISSMIYIANNSSATCTVDSAIYLYGPKVTYFAQIYDGTVSGCIASSAGASSGKYIVVDVDGVDYKIELLANA